MKSSVHTEHYYQLNEQYINDDIAKNMEQLVDIKKDVLKALELKRKAGEIKTSVEADMTLFIKTESITKTY